MRWKLLRRRLSISAPRMTVRSHLPWPLRWAVLALVFGFSAALALWAFEFSRELAGLEGSAKEELKALRIEVAALRAERERTQAVANTAESLLRMEKAAQEQLAQQVRQLEADSQAIKADLGFFEQLLPAAGGESLSIRGLQADRQGPGRLRLQLLLMQAGKSPPEFDGTVEVLLGGTLAGSPWSAPAEGGARRLRLKQYLRVERVLDHDPAAVLQSVQVKVMTHSGAVKATQTLKL